MAQQYNSNPYTVDDEGEGVPYRVLYNGRAIAYFYNIYDANMYVNALLGGKLASYEAETNRKDSIWT